MNTTHAEQNILLFAQPYDISAQGFYFESLEEYEQKAGKLRNSAGFPVEEFEIQFIDGEAIDAQLFQAIGIYQPNIGDFFEAVENWDEEDKIKVIIAVGECGYLFNWCKDDPGDFDVYFCEADSLRELAEQFVEEGLYGEIPERLQYYIDYDAIARDLAVDYGEVRIAGRNLIYRCA